MEEALRLDIINHLKEHRGLTSEQALKYWEAHMEEYIEGVYEYMSISWMKIENDYPIEWSTK